MTEYTLEEMIEDIVIRKVKELEGELKKSLTLPEITSELKEEVIEHSKRELGELYTLKEVLDAFREDENLIIFTGDYNQVVYTNLPKDRRVLFLGEYNIMTGCTAGLYDKGSHTTIKETE